MAVLMWKWLFNVILVSLGSAGTGEGGTRAVCEELGLTRAGTQLPNAPSSVSLSLNVPQWAQLLCKARY